MPWLCFPRVTECAQEQPLPRCTALGAWDACALLGRLRARGAPALSPLRPSTLTPLRHCWGRVSCSRLIYARANSQLPLLSSWGPSVLIGTDEPVSTRHCGWEMSPLREVASCNSQAPAEGSRWV